MINMVADSDSLFEKLRSNSPILQRVAISELRLSRDPQAVEPLIHVVRTGSKGVAVEAARVLAQIGEPSVSSLIGLFMESNHDVWAIASATLLMIGSKAVPGLMEAARSRSIQLQTLAIAVLGQIGDPRPVAILVNAMQSEEQSLHTAAAVALIRIGTSAVEPLLEVMAAFDKPASRRTAIEILKQIGEEAIDPLIHALYGASDLERNQAAWMLSEIGGSAIERLLNALYSDDQQVRYSAAIALGQMKCEAAVPALIKRLDDNAFSGTTGKRVCDAAANALQRINTSEAQAAIQSWKSRV
jgi:HEAT repeat protein